MNLPDQENKNIMDRTLGVIRVISFTLLCVSTFPTSLFGQLTREQEDERKKVTEIFDRSEGQRPRPPAPKRIFGNLTREQEKRITPSGEVVAKYRTFLKSSKTGIVKILPDPKCDARIVNANDLKCLEALPIAGRGSWYSFREKSHRALFWSDIACSDNHLSVGFTGLLLGLIVELGDADIASVNLNTEEVRFINGFLPAKSLSEIHDRRLLAASGLQYNGKTYRTAAPARLNKTYAMRSIKYYRVKEHKWANYYDDMTLALKIIDTDPEGAITLLWKELEKKSKVKIPD